LADRLRALDERHVWVDRPRSLRLTPGLALGLGLFAVCLYVGWALVWGWPRALLAVVGLAAALIVIARFWFSHPERRPRVRGGRVGHDVDEVRRTGVEATS
jgi:membrane protein implicated in regulation of membrane protease activity